MRYHTGMLYNLFSFGFVAGLVFTGELWLLAQIEPPGGKWVRVVLLVVALLVALGFGWASVQTVVTEVE